MSTGSVPPSMRERQRVAAREEIASVARELVLAQGFGATTVDQIAAAAGISRRSFFHRFPSKEDVVLGDLDALGAGLLRVLEGRPRAEDAWTALREALGTLRGEQSDSDLLAMAEIYAATPSLRARHLEKHLRWHALLAPEVERRLGVPPVEGGDPRAIAVVAAALSCLDVAVEAWRRSGGTADMAALFDDCVAAVRS